MKKNTSISWEWEEEKKKLLETNTQLRDALDAMALSAQDLQLAKCHFEAILKSTTEGLMVVNPSGEVTVSNPIANGLLGLNMKIKEKHSLATLRNDRNARVFDLVEASLQDNHSMLREVAVSDADTQCVLRLSAAPIRDWANRPAGIVAIIQDITKEKDAEKMRSEFVSVASHELKSPMAVIKEGVELVLDGVCGEVTEKQTKILTTVIGNVKRLLRIINDLLDVSRIESGKLELKLTDVCLANIVNEVTAAYKTRMDERGLFFAANVPPDLVIKADADKLIQIFTNLVSNSSKFTAKGGITLAAVDKGNTVECSVEDTGPGLSAEDIPHLFSKFRQFGKKNLTNERGTGLGLSIVKSLVEAHGGKIWVESKLDVGTRFIFELPKKPNTSDKFALAS